MFTKDYNYPDSWYELPCEDERRCYDCECKEQKMDIAADYLEKIVKQLYSKDNLDVPMLESDLDELCYQLKVKLIDAEMQIQRKQEAYLSLWLDGPAIKRLAQK
jgi:hypothetical protein